MDRPIKKMGAAPTAPYSPLASSSNCAIYPLPEEYNKTIRFNVKGKATPFRGGRALVLDRLIAAKPAGIDRAETLQWVANLSDTVGALREKGIKIDTRKGHAAIYELRSHVTRWGEKK